MSSTVDVQGISSKTSEKEVRDFFSFCGKIQNITIKDSSSGSKHAEVTFVKNSAAKTALLLDSTQLGDSQVHVTSATSSTSDSSASATQHDDDPHAVAQEDKPRTRIMAEYLAQGYRLGDQIIQRGIAFDNQHGISERFTTALTNFDGKYDATGKAQNVDQRLGVSDKAAGVWSGLNSYFDQALGTQPGQKLRAFYEQGSRQVIDVHNEALHLANLSGSKFDPQSISGTDRTACGCQAKEQKCGCAPGTCACSSCTKNPDAKGKSGSEPQQVAGTSRTTCNCGADASNCACESGKCACSSCSKNTDEKSSSGPSASGKFEPHGISGTKRTACGCQAEGKKCGCAPGQCACASCEKNDNAKSASGPNKLTTVPGSTRTTCNCGSDPNNCPCEAGKCACSSCSKNPDEKSSSASFKPQAISGTDRTACGCQANEKKCGCAAGQCACASCDKNKDGKSASGPNKLTVVAGNTSRTTCNCGADSSNCPCAPGSCACSSCAKNPDVKSAADPEKLGMEKVAGDRTKCNCGDTAENCPCAPGTCACGSCAKNPDIKA